MSRRLRVCIDARLRSGVVGGVEQFVLGLAIGLSELVDGDEEYLLLAYPDATEWLEPALSDHVTLLAAAVPSDAPGWRRALRKRAPTVHRSWRHVRGRLDRLRSRTGRAVPRLPVSDGTVEGADVQLVHFATQQAFVTSLPTVYHPWDLQHLHLPSYFSPTELLYRDVTYRAFCHRAALVAVASTWVADDVIRHFAVPAEKVAVVPIAAATTARVRATPSETEEVRRKYGLPEQFLFYPAQTWPHKNHLRLLDALAQLAREGLVIPLVSSGTKTDHYPQIERHAHTLGIDGTVKFLGFLPPLDVSCLYRLARALVFPSEFEGWGMPVTEALSHGLPVACSHATALPEQGGDAVLLFDPQRVEAIADAVRRVWTDDELRATLADRAPAQAARYSWERTARTFRAHYRRLGGRPLKDDDAALVSTSLVKSA